MNLEEVLLDVRVGGGQIGAEPELTGAKLVRQRAQLADDSLVSTTDVCVENKGAISGKRDKA